VMIGATSQGVLTSIVPPLSALIGLLIGPSVFGRATGEDLKLPYAISLLAQAYMGALLFAAAVRRYRRPEISAFSTFMGLLLLAGWVVLAVVTISMWEQFRTRFVERIDPEPQFICTIVSSLVIAMVPLGSIAWEQVQWRKKQALRDPGLPRRPPPLPLVMLACCAMVSALLCVAPPRSHITTQVFTDTILAIACFIAVAGFLMRMTAARAGGRRGGLIFLFLLLWIGGPVGFDALRQVILDRRVPLTPIASLSPLGVLIIRWGIDDPLATSFIGWQVALAVLVAVLYYLPLRRRNKSMN
jgi:hypothetical protein